MKPYIKTFHKNEFRTILGHKWGNFWILFLVFFVSIAALAVSRSGLSFLRQKMEDPFINWVNITKEPMLKEFYDEVQGGVMPTGESVMEHFNIHAVEVNIGEWRFVEDINHKKKKIIGRTLAHNSALWEKILNETNIKYDARSSKPLEKNDYGWVVTADYLKKLGFGEDNIPLLMPLTYEDGTLAPMPLYAVVERLPDDIDFVTTNYFYEQYHSTDGYPFYVDSAKYYGTLRFVATGDPDEVREILERELEALDLDWESYTDFEGVYTDATSYTATLPYESTLSMEELDNICRDLHERYPNIYRYYHYQRGKPKTIDPQFVSVMFDNLDKVKEFQLWAKEDPFYVRIDMAQIEAKQNFKLFEKLISGLCVAIMVISMLFVGIFLGFLIRAHFQKISKNLGTIMAFGLANSTIIRIYTGVFSKLVVYSLLTAVVPLVALQYLLPLFKAHYVLNGEILPILNLLDGWVLAFLGAVVVLSAVVTAISMRGKLHATPGDLIYERNK